LVPSVSAELDALSVRSTLVSAFPIPSSQLPVRNADISKIDELVYFKPNQEDGALVQFCDALDLMGPELESAKTSVSFIPTSGQLEGRTIRDYIQYRSAKWPFEWTFTPEMTFTETLKYLSSANRGVVIPSSIELPVSTFGYFSFSEVPFLTSKYESLLRAFGNTTMLIDDLSQENLSALLKKFIFSPKGKLNAISKYVCMYFERGVNVWI
jgi:hypothetical protein